MADWLRLPSGRAINMAGVEFVTTETAEHAAALALRLHWASGRSERVADLDADAVRAYLDRVHVGERT